MNSTFSTEENERESKRLYALLDGGIRQRLLQYKDVKHVAVGLKITAGQVVWQRCFHVYLDKKRPKKELLPAEMIPAEIDGIPTDVHEIPEAELTTWNPPADCSNTSRHASVKGGIQISNGYENIGGQYFVGTLAAIGKDTTTCACRALAITNWHVLYTSPLAGTQIRAGSRIFHPTATTNLAGVGVSFGSFDPVPDPNTTANDIGKVLDGRITTTVDVGVFEINRSCCNCCGTPYENIIHGLETVSPIAFNGIQGRARAHTGDMVFFSGVQSGPSKGYVVSDNATFNMSIPVSVISDPRVTGDADGIFRRTFTGQLKIRTDGTHPCNKNAPKPPGYTGPDFSRFADHGDSGSLLLNSNNMAVGLVFTSDHHSHIAPPLYDLYPVPVPNPAGVPALPAGCAPFTLYGYANHFDDVITAIQNDMGINFEIRYTQKPASGSAGETLTVDEPLQLIGAEWKSRIGAHPLGSAVYAALQRHRDEVIRLVNHCRPVTVTWHRNQGPAFLSAVLGNIQEGRLEIPAERKGVTATQLAAQMNSILLEHGSAELKKDLKEYAGSIIKAIGKGSSFEEMLTALGGE